MKPHFKKLDNFDAEFINIKLTEKDKLDISALLKTKRKSGKRTGLHVPYSKPSI
ncbi:hypothetical protein [Arsenicibacter rosenii]|uniref:hypothetical protein n=1 Tax=Arsenicibacter rosenii TaxID=1750698 RepID=UPI0015A6F791|nr:hypothetical protein [Arsenicibacter rosenii]